MSENRLVVFNIGEMRMGLLISDVVKVVFACEVSPLPNAPLIVLGLIDFHGTFAPVFDMNSRFGNIPSSVQVNNYFIICNMRHRKVALLVDKVWGVIHYNPDTLVPSDEVFPGLNGINGLARISNGIIIVQDLARFLSIEEENALNVTIEEHNPQ